MLAKIDGISFREAQRARKSAIIDVIFRRPRKNVLQEFFQVTEGKWRRILKGKKAVLANTYGPDHTFGYVSRIRKLQSYWAQVHIIAVEYGIEISEARTMIRDKGSYLVLEELGVFAAYPSVNVEWFKEFRKTVSVEQKRYWIDLKKFAKKYNLDIKTARKLWKKGKRV